ncbi:MAG TPA: hemolysin family protein [Chloroflexota bacterium]|nr:hemolysin family protein [Chloroflexota bacterium]
MNTGLGLVAVFALIAANGFFTAAEFALVSARRTRIEQLANRGNRAALAVQRAQADPSRFIAACQLGITVASLALGWIGEATIASILWEPLAIVVPDRVLGLTAHAIAAPLAFLLMTYLHITCGEQVPKMLALQLSEQAALVTVLPTNFIGVIFRPFIRALELSTNLALRMLGVKWEAQTQHVYSYEDLKLMIQASRAAGAIEEDPDRLVERALDFAQLSAHHVMVPRTEMIALPSSVTVDQLADTMARHEHSRYPIYEGTADNVVGILWAKHVAVALAKARGRPVDIRALIRAPLFVPETMRADRLLAEMKRHRSHEAIVIDEYGATAGLVTLRDIMDRLAGEIRDQTELARPTVEWLPDGSTMVDGLMLLGDVETELGIDFGESEYDTVGGFLFGRLGRRPAIGDTINVGDRTLAVAELDGLRVSRVAIRKRADAVDKTAQQTQAVGS